MDEYQHLRESADQRSDDEVRSDVEDVAAGRLPRFAVAATTGLPAEPLIVRVEIDGILRYAVTARGLRALGFASLAEEQVAAARRRLGR